MSDHPMTTLLPALAGSTLGGVFGALAKVRRGKPLHGKGAVFDAVIRRTGSPSAWGAAWLDTPGEDHGSARLSRAAGLPDQLPDVQGLALTFTGADGDRHDLLLASTGLAPGARFVLVPRRAPLTCPYGSLLPYVAPRGLVLLAAVPAAPVRRPGEPLRFRLLAAGLVGGWHQFATLELTEPPGGAADEPLRLDPVLHVLPGLRWPAPLALLREPAYAAARRTPVRGGVTPPPPPAEPGTDGASAAARSQPPPRHRSGARPPAARTRRSRR